MKFGIIKEGKVPQDNRVAFTPKQCKWLQQNKGITVLVQSSAHRCFTDEEYRQEGIEVVADVSSCDVLFGIKEIPVDMLIPEKTYFFFSHTRKMQPYNQKMMRDIVSKKITLVDYECLEHADGARVLGFGFFAGVVGAHNGMWAYGNRTGEYRLERIYEKYDFESLTGSYFGLRLPNVKVVVTGSGRVAHGILEVMTLMGMHQVEPDEFLSEEFSYPVYVNLKGAELYRHKSGEKYDREKFHEHPEEYDCLFRDYLSATDILLNGVYWDEGVPRLFELEDMKRDDFRIKTISDITDDYHGSVPCNLGDGTIQSPIYGVDRMTSAKTAPYLNSSVDIVAVGNLPNELPKDASRYFGEQLIKYVVDNLGTDSPLIHNATITRGGALTDRFSYLKEYAGL